jgi:hypothetical protein
MNSLNDPLEIIWDSLLSQDSAQIQNIFNLLDPASQRSVLLHLQRMVIEPGWLPIQKQSAQTALDVLPKKINDTSPQE